MNYQAETPGQFSLFWRASLTSSESLQLQKKYKFSGRFRLLERLGQGGFGEVWRAQDLLLVQEVALKISVSDLIQETLVLRRLPKDRYISIFDYVSDDSIGATAYSMELLEGPWVTLSDYSETYLRQQLDNPAKFMEGLRTIISISIDVLRSLGALHGVKYGKKNRWNHGDIKPQNIYVNRQGVKLALTKSWGSVSSFTKIGDLDLPAKRTRVLMVTRKATHRQRGRLDPFHLPLTCLW